MKVKTINGWTKAKIIDKLEQMMPDSGRCIEEDGDMCQYRNDDGKACAIGAFIPDTFREALGYIGYVKALLNEYPEVKDYMPITLETLDLFQCVHDRWNDDLSEYASPKLACIAWVREHVID